MKPHLLALLLLAALPLTGCKKGSFAADQREPAKPAATPAATPAAGAAAVAADATPKPDAEQQFNPTAEVIVFCYHRFEDRPKDSLAIAPKEFEAQMQELKDKGIEVISMQDFIAWKKGEKSIPERAAVISIDDGYRSGHDVAWPILKKFGYPFTMFIYTDYVKGQPKSGGESLTWEQLGGMRDGGVDIQSHTVSHSNLRSKKRGQSDEEYKAWILEELSNSKELLESKLAIRVNALAYPYGNYNDDVRAAVKQAGYDVAFTVYGQKLAHSSADNILGRYAITSTEPKVFQSAVSMQGGTTAAGAGSDTTEIPASSMVTQPADGDTVSDPYPEIKVNITQMGAIDPKSVEMRISGFGIVPAKLDAKTKVLSFKPTQKLRAGSYSVIVLGKDGDKTVKTRWNFTFDPEKK